MFRIVQQICCQPLLYKFCDICDEVCTGTCLFFSVNILVLGTEDGHLHMYAYGLFPMGTVDLNDHGAGKV